MKVDRYVEPAEFDRWKQIAEDMGFLYVASGPLVRSSYKVSVDCSLAQFSLISRPGGRILHRECTSK
jgi:lipoate synthase